MKILILVGKLLMQYQGDKYENVVVDGEDHLTWTQGYNEHILKNQYNKRLLKSGIPNYYWDLDFSDYIGEHCKLEVEQVKKYAERCHTDKFNYVHLYLWGKHSSQKTTLASHVGKYAIKNGMIVKFVLAKNLINALMKNQGFNRDEEATAFLHEITNCDLVIIDDGFDSSKSLLWKNNGRDLILSEWDGFLRDMVTSLTRVVITSNIPVKDIKESYGESLYELIDRNFIKIKLLDSVKEERKINLKGLLD